MKNRVSLFIIVIVATVLVTGCMSVGGVLGYRTLQSGVAKDNQANEEYIKSIVTPDMDLKTSLNIIYAVKFQGNGPYRVEKVLSEMHNGGLKIDVGIFKSLCDIKKGELYRWNYSRNVYFTCEVSGIVDLALAIEPHIREHAARVLYYDTRQNFNDYIQRQEESNFDFMYYQSKNAVFQIGSTGRDEFHLVVRYHNDSKAPQSVDLNNSYVMVDGGKYIIKFRNSPQDTRITLNPSESIDRGFVVDIPGLRRTALSGDLKIVADGAINGDNFERTSLYDRTKQPSKGKI